MRALGWVPSPSPRRSEAASLLELGKERVSGSTSGSPGAGRSRDPATKEAKAVATKRRIAARASNEPSRRRQRLAMERPRHAGNEKVRAEEVVATGEKRPAEATTC